MSITLATLLLQAASTPAAPPVEPPAAQEDPTAAATGGRLDNNRETDLFCYRNGILNRMNTLFGTG